MELGVGVQVPQSCPAEGCDQVAKRTRVTGETIDPPGSLQVQRIGKAKDNERRRRGQEQARKKQVGERIGKESESR
jgi:hypothetical protein